MTLSQTQRKPVLGKINTGKFKQHDFQIQDIGFLGELDNSANWSEMLNRGHEDDNCGMAVAK